MIDIIKTFAGFVIFFALAPAYGFVVAKNPKLLRANLAIMIFATTMPQTWWSFQIASMKLYRGHTRGFEINFLLALALSSIIGALYGPHKKEFRFWVPGALLYALFVVACTLSLKDAIDRSYVLMATFKFSLALLMIVCVYNSIRGASDVRLFQNALAVALIVQFLLCVKYKYVDGIYRVKGNFPHSNNLGMYAYVTGLFLLAAIQQSVMSSKRAALIAGGYISAMGLAFITISRACFASAIVGSGAIMALSIMIQPRLKKFGLASTLILPTAVGGAKVADQILARAQSERPSTEEFGTLRDAMETQAQAMLADHPFGVGWNNFCLANSRPYGDYADILIKYVYDTAGYTPTGFRNPLIENLYWLILGETGYLAFIVFVLFQLRILLMAWLSILTFRTNELGAVALALSVILPIQFWHWYLERIVTDTPMLMIFLMLIGLLAKIATWKQQIAKGQITEALLLSR